LCRHILGDVEVCRHRLHIVIFLERVDQLHQLCRSLKVYVGAVLRFPDQLCCFSRASDTSDSMSAAQ
jgi:hypothetical protein